MRKVSEQRCVRLGDGSNNGPASKEVAEVRFVYSLRTYFLRGGAARVMKSNEQSLRKGLATF